jgi:hypothetical protein
MDVLADGARKCRAMAGATLAEVKERMGLAQVIAPFDASVQ